MQSAIRQLLVKTSCTALLGFVLLAAIGCSKGSSTGTTATPDEQKYYEHPKLEPPPGASQMGPPPANKGAPEGGAPADSGKATSNGGAN